MDVARESGEASLESDAKFSEAALLFNRTHNRVEERRYDAISGEDLDIELTKEARKKEMETSKKRGVYEKAPLGDCWKNAGKAPVGAEWVDAKKGRQGGPLAPMQVGRQGDQERPLRRLAHCHWRRRKCRSHCGRASLGCAWTSKMLFAHTSTQRPDDERARSCQKRTTKKASAAY